MITDTRIRYTFRMPEALFQAIEKRAQAFGVSVNAMILQILWDWLKANDQSS